MGAAAVDGEPERTNQDAPNIVVVLSDEHAAAASGCYGHPVVQTPNLDRLAAEGTLYENAYCPSPMCVPSRLSMLSGRHVHDIGAWDNGVLPGAGFRSWGHHLRAAGYETVLAGRTHFNGPDRLLGFDRRLTDDLDFWITHDGRPPRRVPEWRRGSNSHVTEVGAAEHVHTRHDVNATDAAVEYLRGRARRPGDRPFLLYVGYMHPHFPLVAPPEFLAAYDPATVELPPTWDESVQAQHPVIAQVRRAFRNDEPPGPDLQREATACYWALISHLDHQVGRLLDEVDGSSLRDRTVVIYTSDHGEMAGHHGIWQKQVFYEPAVKVPLIVRTPGDLHEEPRRRRVTADVSLIDLLPTLRDLAGLSPEPSLPGRSLLSLPEGSRATRPVLSQYHAQGMVDGGFMLKLGRYKYCYYVHHPPQLFDVVNDPLERVDLAGDPDYAAAVGQLDAELRRVVDPETTDRRAKEDQRRRATGSADLTSPACSRDRGR
ncbi:sulfatase-like hydrolase/transferase [Phytoactinopolyspora halotolerans]|uniref:Sulfatase-like hydrolase/transferase n=1 Tax=Phytoactinopolyspora halotolerans TaxID=1981512 RepID=A0A6L9S4D4_9ACTN|nr:sulfatase-like hydrolase/transferase [Phytoactinopolyspora halotolerans]NED98879.1 sulfatase-like hydrolase/transferase [Phytoactinopolyspora halotolerans]